MRLQEYIATLPLIKTADLPTGALFLAHDRLYEVVETQPPGYNRARVWRDTEKTDVALVENSTLARTYRLISEGRHIPGLPSREALRHNGQTAIFVFPVARTALEAAYLDTALCGASSGVYVRRHANHSAFEVTNGLHIFRQYYYMRSDEGVKTSLPDIKHRLGSPLIPHIDGPMYWRLLPSWTEAAYDDSQTVHMRPVEINALIETEVNNRRVSEPPYSDEDTIPHIPPQN